MGFFDFFRKKDRSTAKNENPSAASVQAAPLPAPPPPSLRIAAPANRLVDIYNESLQVMETTKDPEVFFSRLHTCFDVLLTMAWYGRMKTLRKQSDVLIPAFVDRYISDAQEQASVLKTETGRKNRLLSRVAALREGFDRATTYWKGWRSPVASRMPLHYEGSLYSDQSKEYMLNETEKLLRSTELPANPTEVVEPAEITETVQPTESIGLTEPVATSEPVETAEIVESVESVESTENTEIAEAIETVAPHTNSQKAPCYFDLSSCKLISACYDDDESSYSPIGTERERVSELIFGLSAVFEECSKLSPKFHSRNIREGKILFEDDRCDNDYSYIEYDPFTPTGKIRKYPTLLYFFVNYGRHSYEGDTIHGTLKFNAENRLSTGFIVSWYKGYCYQISCAFSDGQQPEILSITKTSLKTDTQTLLYQKPDPEKQFKEEGFPKILNYVKTTTTTGSSLTEILDVFSDVPPTAVKYVVRKLSELGDLTKRKDGRSNRYFATVILDPDYTEKWNLPKPEPEDPYVHLQEVLIGPEDPGYQIHPDVEGLLWFADGPMKNYQPGDYPEYDQIQALQGPWNGKEPSAIQFELEIAHPVRWDEIPKVPYYPSYSRLTPEQRWIFLAWLRTPYEPIEAGYAFLLYYCLKRRIALDSQLPRCINLLTKLLEVQQNGSFQGYASDLLEFARMKYTALQE